MAVKTGIRLKHACHFPYARDYTNGYGSVAWGAAIRDQLSVNSYQLLDGTECHSDNH